MSFTPGDPRAPSAGPRTSDRTLPGDPRSRPARGTGEVLVTGATGFLGQVVCRMLGERHIHHRALVRVNSGSRVESGAYTWRIEGDLCAPASLDGALDGVRVVLHLAGVLRSEDPARFDAVHLHGTRALLRPGVERIVAISSDTVTRARRDPYAQSKAAMEELLASVEGAVVLRPPMMLGPGSRHLESLRRAARWPVVPVPAGAAKRAPVHVEDVAAAVLQAMALEGAAPRVLDLPGAEEVDFGALVQAVARAEGWRVPRVITVPGEASDLVARGLARLGQGGRSAALRARVAGMQEAAVADGEAARALLQWAPRSLRAVLAPQR